jgi:hypothetical protein
MGFWANIFYGMLILILLYITSIIALRILSYIIEVLHAIIRRDIENLEYICNCLCSISYCCIYKCKNICKCKYNKQKRKVKPIIYNDNYIIIISPLGQCYIGTKCEIVNS